MTSAAAIRNFVAIDRGRIDRDHAVPMAVVTVLPIVLGLALNQVEAGLIATLGAFNAYVALVPGVRWDGPQLRTVLICVVVNAFAIAIGTLLAFAGVFAPVLFGIAFFVLAYGSISRNRASVGMVAAVVLALGVGLPGAVSPLAAWDRFWLVLAGGGLGLLAAWLWTRPRPALRTLAEDPPGGSPWHFGGLDGARLRFSIAFGVAGAIGLAIAVDLGVSRDYWVLLTFAVIMLGSAISAAPVFALRRVAGTLVGAALGVLIVAAFLDPWALVGFAFVAGLLYFLLRGVNYAVGTLFITVFVLVLVNVPAPGQTGLAEARIADTLIGAALALATLASVWLGERILQRGPPVHAAPSGAK